MKQRGRGFADGREESVRSEIGTAFAGYPGGRPVLVMKCLDFLANRTGMRRLVLGYWNSSMCCTEVAGSRIATVGRLLELAVTNGGGK